MRSPGSFDPGVSFFNLPPTIALMTFAPFLAAAATTEGTKNIPQQIAETFGWNPTLFFSQLISFLVLAFLLRKFAFQPILQVLAERRQRIAEGIASADKARAELANTQVKIQELLGQAGQQATKIIEEARAAAARVGEQETQKAIATANDIIAKAKVANESELVRLKGELRKEFGRLVVSAAGRASGKILTPEDQKRLAEEANHQLAA